MSLDSLRLLRMKLFFFLQTYWTEFIQLSKIRQIQRDAADTWLRACLRYVATNKHNMTTAKTLKVIDPAGTFSANFHKITVIHSFCILIFYICEIDAIFRQHSSSVGHI